jgi:hypothetical protein
MRRFLENIRRYRRCGKRPEAVPAQDCACPSQGLRATQERWPLAKRAIVALDPSAGLVKTVSIPGRPFPVGGVSVWVRLAAVRRNKNRPAMDDDRDLLECCLKFLASRHRGGHEVPFRRNLSPHRQLHPLQT